MAVDLGFNTNVISGKNISEVTFSTIFSRSYPLTERGYKVTPYGGVQLSALYGSYLPKNETDYYVFGGAEWRVESEDHALRRVEDRQPYSGRDRHPIRILIFSR